MLNHILLDVVGPEVLIALGLTLGALGLGLCTVIVLGEAALLWVFKWGSFRLSLVASLVMNTVSSIVGVLISFAGASFLSGWGFLIAFVLSVLIEWGTLALFNREKIRNGLLPVALANIASYALLFIIWITTL